MAALGFRSMEEMVGRVDKLEINPDVLHYKSRGLDLSALLTPATSLNENHSGVTKSFEQVRVFLFSFREHDLFWVGGEAAVENPTRVSRRASNQVCCFSFSFRLFWARDEAARRFFQEGRSDK